MYPPTIAVQKQPQINAFVSEVVKEFFPDVQRIRFEFAQDWTGEWAVYFHVLLSDKASKRANLRKIAPRVRRIISDKIIPELDMMPHFDFTSQSEQAELKDPAWA